MFKDTNNGEDETSFSEAYRSQILNKDDDIEEESSKNLVVILVLVIIVVALGIFGYSYLSKNNQTEVVKKESIKEESIKEEPTTEEEVIEPPESMMLNNISELMDEEEGSNSTEQNKSSDSIKIEMEKETTPKEKKTSKQKGEDTYLEQLAELSKEIDGEK